MTITRTLFVGLFLAVAAVVSVLSALPVDSANRPAWVARTIEISPDSMAFASTLASMRDLHRRMLSAESDNARRALLPQSAQLMQDGIAMMRQMKKDLPTTESGEFVSNTITQADAERVQDFLALMELLVQTRDDQEATRQGRMPNRLAIAPSALV